AGFLQLLTDALPVRMAYVDTEERFRYANHLYYSWLGLPKDEVIGATILEVLGQGVYKGIRPYIRKALGGERNRFETEIEYRNHGKRQVVGECAPHFDENGQVIGAFGLIFDITDRKEAERKNAWLAAIVQSSTYAIVSKDFDGTVRSWNRGAEQIYGYSAEEMIGNMIDRLYPAEMREDILATVKELRQGHQVPPFETTRLRKDGTVVDVLLSLSPILGSSGKPIAVSVLATDISARKKAERELQDLNRNLEEKIEERTRSLEQHMVQLRKVAMDLTQSEQRERERLSAILHDDMQQLLVAAGLRLERLEDKLKDENQQEILQEAANLLGRASSVARNLANDLRPPMLSGVSLTEGLRWLVEWTWQRFDLAVRLEVADNFNPDSIPRDQAAYLLGVVRELLFNVVKHAQVKIAKVRLDDNHRNGVMLSVEDHGVGSESRQLDQLAESVKGVGLRSIGERLGFMGGSLSIETGAGKGFRVEISLPYAKSNVIRKRCGSMSGKKVSSSPSNVRKIRVMLVDDHHLIREGLRLVLEDEGDLEVVAEAENGRQAVLEASRSRPDVIVMDINMPEMDGIEATRQIKKVLPGTCVVGLSVDGDSERLPTMLEAGACAFLEKDGPTEELLRTIHRCFHEKQKKESG
ncbi:MAG: PAS domain S-box protein, partial [Deltaproteobacteria bacterium]